MEKKKLAAIVFFGAAVVGGWAVVREKAARENAVEYLRAKEIPTYHLLSFHRSADRNAIGYCSPCGEKARAVIAADLKGKLDELERAAKGK